MNKSVLLLGAMLGASTPAIAAAEPAATGFYVQLHGGVSALQDPKGTFYAPGGTFSGGDDGEVTIDAIPTGSDTIGAKFHAKSAAGVNFDIGYDFGMIRAEIGVDYARNKLNGITIRSINGAAPGTLSDDDAQNFCDYLADGEESPTCTASGSTIKSSGSFAKLRQLAVMASVWVDIPTGLPIEPYVGGGIGAVGYHVQTADDGDGKVRFGWQLGAGVAYHFTPHFALTADYRYRQASGTTLFRDDEEGTGLALRKLKTSLFSAGLRYTF